MFAIATIAPNAARSAAHAGLGAIPSASGGTVDTVVLWVVCAIMFVGVLSFGYLRLRKATATSRGFYDKSMIIVTVATCSYLAMALGIGSIHPQGINAADSLTHRVYIPRYVDWAITTPLLLLDVILFSKPLLNRGWQWDAFVIVAFDIVMIVTGVISGLVTPPSRWFFFWASVLAYAVVAGYVVTLFLKSRRIQEPLVANKLRTLTGMLSVLWLIYPFIFALYFGGAMGGTTEDICYAVLDVSAKFIFGFVLLLGPAVELVDKAMSVAPKAEESERDTSTVGRVGIAR
jgi:bacteriorhodopsin